MQNKFNFMPGGDFAGGGDMKLGKIHPRQLGYRAFVINKNFYLRLLSKLFPENSNDFILTRLYRSLCHVKSL